LAGHTNQISLDTCLIDMLFHNPVVLARRFATLDVLSHGRAIAGLGIGWSKDEYEVSGIHFEHRGQRANEFLQILKRIWTDEVVEFKGQFYSIPASKIGPKPVQKPHPPILLGGFSPKTFLRKLCRWLVTRCWVWALRTAKREDARKANKDPSTIRVFALTYPNVQDSSSSSSSSPTSEQQRLPMTGTIDQIGTDINEIKAMGAEHIIFGHAFSTISKDMKKMVEVTVQLARFAK
jgi:alkanesulfonate monooxygenase SsuD/methylene tetrahydromethanopterin reductase-like flavin-dependent oxidoreductase (luciferase family)